MAPKELQAFAYDLVEIAFLSGSLGAVAVIACLVVLRGMTDWFLDREERRLRIAQASMRGQCGPLLLPGEGISRSRFAKVLRARHRAQEQQPGESARSALAGACDRMGEARTSGM